MKQWAEYAFLLYGGIWLVVIETILLKHSSQGAARLARDYHRAMMEDTINGPRLGQSRPWEPGEKRELALMRASTWLLLLGAAALFVILEI